MAFSDSEYESLDQQQNNLPDTLTDSQNDPLEKFNRVDVGKALKLRLVNKLPYRAIGDQLHCSHEAVRKALKPFLKLIDNPLAIEGYQANKAALLTAAEMRLLKSIMDEDAIDKASLNNRAYAFDKISNQGHLARGEATANINYHVLSQSINECDAEIDRLERELAGA